MQAETQGGSGDGTWHMAHGARHCRRSSGGGGRASTAASLGTHGTVVTWHMADGASGTQGNAEWSHGTWREGTAAAAAAAVAPQPPRRFAAFGGVSPHASGFGPPQWENEEEQEGGAGGCGSPAPQGLAAAAAAPGSATGSRAGSGFAQAYASGAAAQQQYNVVNQDWDRNKHYPVCEPNGVNRMWMPNEERGILIGGVQGFWVWEPNEETWMWMPHDEYVERLGNRLMTDDGINLTRLGDH